MSRSYLQDYNLTRNGYELIGKATLGILHDLSADLTFLQMCLKDISTEVGYDSKSSNSTYRNLSLSQSSVARMIDLLGSATNQCKHADHLQKFNPLLVALQISNLFRSKLHKHNIQLTMNGKILDWQHTSFSKNTEIHIISFRQSFERILLNLLSNAIDACVEYKSANVRDISRGTRIDLKLYLEDDIFILICRDNGLGISADIKKTLFSHGSSTKNRVAAVEYPNTNEILGGLGIGLSLVKKIVKSLQGNIFLDSDPSWGTSFEIRWPKITQSTTKLVN